MGRGGGREARTRQRLPVALRDIHECSRDAYLARLHRHTHAYADPYLNYKVGTIPVSATGTFSVANVKWTSSYHSPARTTTSTVNGRFTTAKTATGTIHYRQTDTTGAACSGERTFTAKTP